MAVEIASIAGPLTRPDDVGGFIFRDLRGQNQQGDAYELGLDTIQPVASAANSAFGRSLVNTLTPYFHFDISSAERDVATACGALRQASFLREAPKEVMEKEDIDADDLREEFCTVAQQVVPEVVTSAAPPGTVASSPRRVSVVADP